MKRLLSLLTLAACASCMVDRDRQMAVDYGFVVEFDVKNNSSSALAITINDLSQTTIIEPGEQKTFHETWGMCGKDYVPEDFVFNRDYTGGIGTVAINGTYVSPLKFWTKENWNFASEPYYALYTLIITDEMLDSFK